MCTDLDKGVSLVPWNAAQRQGRYHHCEPTWLIVHPHLHASVAPGASQPAQPSPRCCTAAKASLRPMMAASLWPDGLQAGPALGVLPTAPQKGLAQKIWQKHLWLSCSTCFNHMHLLKHCSEWWADKLLLQLQRMGAKSAVLWRLRTRK